MEETIQVYKNDTVRAIENQIEHVKKWSKDNDSSNPRETALVITKLEEAMMWAYKMVKRAE